MAMRAERRAGLVTSGRLRLWVGAREAVEIGTAQVGRVAALRVITLLSTVGTPT